MSIHSCPPDTLSHTLGFLPPEEIRSSVLVCRGWRPVAVSVYASNAAAATQNFAQFLYTHASEILRDHFFQNYSLEQITSDSTCFATCTSMPEIQSSVEKIRRKIESQLLRSTKFSYIKYTQKLAIEDLSISDGHNYCAYTLAEMNALERNHDVFNYGFEKTHSITLSRRLINYSIENEFCFDECINSLVEDHCGISALRIINKYSGLRAAPHLASVCLAFVKALFTREQKIIQWKVEKEAKPIALKTTVELKINSFFKRVKCNATVKSHIKESIMISDIVELMEKYPNIDIEGIKGMIRKIKNRTQRADLFQGLRELQALDIEMSDDD